jgi:hypothetical protein
MNLIETRPIGQIIRNSNTPAREPRFEHFLIPYYQRGYRWETSHVEALLDDIHNFIQSKEDNYCLQPVVVIPSLDEESFNRWEVVDGQQRLITLHIIFQHLKKASHVIAFEKRKKSTDFLKELSASNYDHSNPDFHFLSNAHLVISGWFKKRTELDVSYEDEFYTTITKKVQVIWYQLPELNEEDKIDIFNRLNIGKIPLTDAELIRALLLSKVKFGLTDRESIMRQAEISSEWNTMEHELRKEEFWYFLNNDVKDKMSSRIEYLFNIIAGRSSANHSTYLWFEKAIKNDKEELESKLAFDLWDQTKALFAKLKSWFNQRSIYHLVGFLLANNYPIKNILENSKCTKSQFQVWLKNEITDSMSEVDLTASSYGQPEMEKIFLLFNILTVDGLNATTSNRFPFNYYKKIKHEDGGWSIEHIHAQQSEPLKDEKAIRKWLDETVNVIKHIPDIEIDENLTNDGISNSRRIEISSEYTDRINKLLSSTKIDVDAFNILKEQLIEVFDSSSVHELDNLALLSKKDNSALSNAIFPVKRNKIIALEKAGKYIPACTRNVFLKFYSQAENQPYYWGKNDKERYFDAIAATLKPYLN